MRNGYTPEYVRGLVEEYSALKERADTDPAGLRHLIELADLHYALDLLPDDLFAAVLVVGLLGIEQQMAAGLLLTSQRSVSRRYRDALAEVTFHMNGDY